MFNMENICNEDGAIRKKSLNFAVNLHEMEIPTDLLFEERVSVLRFMPMRTALHTHQKPHLLSYINGIKSLFSSSLFNTNSNKFKKRVHHSRQHLLGDESRTLFCSPMYKYL